MSINKTLYCLLCICLLFVTEKGKAQVTNRDTTVIAAFLQIADSLFLKAANETLDLYIGREYVSSDNRVVGQPCFITDGFEEGTINYFNQTFSGVPLKYDIFTNHVITQYYNGKDEIALNDRKIASFSYLSYKFVRISTDSSIINHPPEGFYQILHDGKAKVYAKRRKTILESLTGKTIRREYVAHDDFYIKKDNIFFTVTSKKTAFIPFIEFKKELIKALRKNKVKFRKSKEKFLVVVAEEYDKLSNQ